MKKALPNELRDILEEMAQLSEAISWLGRYELCRRLDCCVARQKRLVTTVERRIQVPGDLSLRPELEAFRDAQRTLLQRIVLRYGRVESTACLC